MSGTKVKVCGLTRTKDALFAASRGAEYLGVVLVPETPRFRTPEEARLILDGSGAHGVIVVANQEVTWVSDAARTTGADVIQLHGEEPPEFIASLRRQGPWKIWRALAVRGPEDVIHGIAAFGTVVDGLLLDAWHPERQGGTGRVFSWEAVAEVRDRVPDDLLLAVAGGLGPENVSQAISCLEPDLVDVSSGVEEEPGIKSSLLVEAFIRNAKGVKRRGRP
ncbi:MAG: phosphoribosylanthranilate isomerase [Gemmatimonadetes bacterium]|nr:phosphoribosylanthranilate isomerase [Gemmatimonadota bacterium]NNM05106.1 phosphoribosylanthranilate isomerase [Gemmatimonadota bacterium]